MTPWLKTELTVTSQRFLAHKANTVLGIFPLGYNDIAMPLQSISAVSLNKKFHIGRMVIALILFMIGSGMFSNGHSFGGIFFLLLMVVLLLTTVDTQLNLSNNAGSTTGIGVSILEEAKLEGFKQEVEQRLYADRALLMHQESLQQATTAAGVQQAQMSALLAQAQLQNQLNMGQQPKDQPDNQ
ncbi:hypothetical protein [Cutibacterium sp.]|uniref:hypothetical protein n=1 Tax=Cutibacterium sp. TaxID=1912221 RepID=UPI0034C5C61C